MEAAPGAGFHQCAVQSVQGFVIGLEKPNQDSAELCAWGELGSGGAAGSVFGVFDGHGPQGHTMSQFVAGNLFR